MDYSKTVNLPKTSFSMKGNLPVREPELLEFWQRNSIYEKLRKKNSSGKKFVLHDGPPYANGHIHLGTALNKILKDIVIKSRFIEGYSCPFVPGWDCHGLPIEQQLLKELKSDKNEIIKQSGVLTFRKKAAEYARKFVEIQKNEFKRLGVFADWETPYLTLEPYYESVLIDVFGELVKKNFIYRKKKPVYWCPTCQTALADAEVEYADHISHSIYVKFPVAVWPSTLPNFRFPFSAYVIIWTTTPWTLPANVAVAFNPEEMYVFIKINDEVLILAEKRLKDMLEKIGIKDYEVIATHKGKELEYIECKNPVNNKKSVGVLADFVSMEDGTGIVHIAPGHGVEDYQVGLKYNLEIISPVDDAGVFTSEVADFAGHKVFAANHLIVEKIKSYLLRDEQITHSYPHCWRCKRAIIFRATEQWFLDVNTSGLKEKLLSEIKKVRWIPDYGEKRISSMIQQRPDWCLSRQRLWGTPIPVFYCLKCDTPVLDEKVIRNISAIFSQFGSDIWYEKTTEQLIAMLDCQIQCPSCQNATFRKESDIFDVWFDSGVSSFAVLNPKNFPELNPAPTDMYLEGSDQHRGWFQTSLIPSVAINNSAPYRTVLTHGFVVDGEGKKMSKSLGNVISPESVINMYGADILRLWVASSDYTEDIRLSKDILSGLVEVYRKIRNTLRYILGNISDMPPEEKIPFKDRREIDRYILHRFSQLALIIEEANETYQFHKTVYYINNFCVNDLSSFYFDILKDCLYTYGRNSYERRSAQSTLEDIFLGLEKYISPILSFTAEDAWQSYKTDRNLAVPESVFLNEMIDYRKFREDANFDGKWIEYWDRLLSLRDAVNLEIEKLREKGIIGSSLECEVTIFPDNEEKDILSEYKKDLPMIFIVSKVDIGKVSADGTKIEVKKSSFKKCARCWNYREDVSKNPSGLEICGRCYEIIK